jgi:hypothetical protein
MTNSNLRDVSRIGSICSAAIREEIGVRMRIEMAREHEQLPQRLVALLDTIRTND